MPPSADATHAPAPRAPERLHVEEIATLAGLEALRPEWLALWQGTAATPFQSPDWLIPWWRHLGQGTLLTLAIRDVKQEGLVGLVPLFVHTAAEGGAPRRVLPLGIGTSDYLDAIAAPNRADAVMAAALAHLAARSRSWDEASWPQLRPRATLLQAPAPAGWTDHVAESEPCPVLHLPDRVELLAEVVPSRMRQNLRTAHRRAAQAGRLCWERAESRNLEEIFEAQLRLHRARWRERGKPGVLASEAVQAAHREALPGMLRAGLLRLDALRLDGRILATLYALADRPGAPERRVYFYLGGFDPRAAALSPGTLLIGHAIEEAVREGAIAFDFLRGGEAYKYRWGGCDTATWCRRLGPPPIRGG
jgi:CelD/BcsL family acetyltransferase involved in cellulose biosynthesis